MNSFLLLIIGLPALEILLFIKIGGLIGALNTILLIIITAILGVYFARVQGFNTLRSGIINIYQNKTPIYDLISGASIALAAMLLILPGFITDLTGLFLLLPLTRKFLINYLMSKNKIKNKDKDTDDVIEAEIIEDKKDEL